MMIDDKVDGTVPTCSQLIYDYVKETREGYDTNIYRASSASQCSRRLWYQKRGTQGARDIAPRTALNFLQGDIGELTIKSFIKAALVGKFYSEVDFGILKQNLMVNKREIEIYEQQTVETQGDGFDILGHVDGWGKRLSDGAWELIEVKTASNWGYKEFVEGSPGEYLYQANVLLYSNKGKELNATGVRFYYLRKETGHIYDKFYPKDESKKNEALQKFLQAGRDAPPPRSYLLEEETVRRNPTGRFTCCSYPCGYCPYLQHCHGEFEVEMKANQFGQYTPKYIFKKGSL